MSKPVKIIDLFAGPGGLGEGFSAIAPADRVRPFRIALSIENEPSAHATLTLRSFYRQFPYDQIPSAYFEYMEGHLGKHPDEALFRMAEFGPQVAAAKAEARLLTLGKDTRSINKAIGDALGNNPDPWVLIGGPPCQAYSLVGRSRNKGVAKYRPEKDERNYLYREYLKVLSRFAPDVFVMENVKGMLSASVAGKNMFAQILSDLECPARALQSKDRRIEYELVPLGLDGGYLGRLESTNPSDYVVRSEKFGVPQSRHRVIVLGIRTDRTNMGKLKALRSSAAPSIEKVIHDLPSLRSGLSKEPDSFHAWSGSIRASAKATARAVRQGGDDRTAEAILDAAEYLGTTELDRGSNWATSKLRSLSAEVSEDLRNWYSNFGQTDVVINHDTRGHRADDLQRYLFCASFSSAHKKSGHVTPRREEFPELLYPKHRSWESGAFADRFRVQARNKVATTITSHISKDGHYFIHYDPVQCRSLTVREAARVQSFPDDYFFVGTRTQQYVQVGNAVPPYLARQLAQIVLGIVRR